MAEVQRVDDLLESARFETFTKWEQDFIDFGKLVKWIGFTPEQALEIANNLKTRAQLILIARKIKP